MIKAQCATCHVAPYSTDNLMHNLKAERFFKPQLINGRHATADGPIKTFPLQGIKRTLNQLLHLAQSAKQDELRVTLPRTEAIRLALAFVISARTQETAIATWFSEAFNRDSGFGD